MIVGHHLNKKYADRKDKGAQKRGGLEIGISTGRANHMLPLAIFSGDMTDDLCVIYLFFLSVLRLFLLNTFSMLIEKQ
jgi:hypothetical protein